MKCPECKRGDELRLARAAIVWCQRCHILTDLRAGGRVPGLGRLAGKTAEEFAQALAERGMPRRVTP